MRRVHVAAVPLVVLVGVVGCLLDGSFGVGEESLLLVQLIDDFHLKIEAFEGVNSMLEAPEFTEKSVTLYR